MGETVVAEIKTRPFKLKWTDNYSKKGAVGGREVKRSQVNIVMRENMLDFKQSVHS